MKNRVWGLNWLDSIVHIFIIFLSISLSLACAEFVARYIIKYPTLGIDCFVEGLDIFAPIHGRIYQPYAKTWTVEGGNTVVQKNNIGLSGADINISDASKYIMLMGTSFIQAAELPREKIASYILHNNIKKIDSRFQIVNIAYRNNDPYAQYYRLIYFMQRFKPWAGILVIDTIYPDEFWISRYDKHLSFALKPDQFRKVTSAKVEIPRIIRNHSAFLNLAVRILGTLPTESMKPTSGDPFIDAMPRIYNYSYVVYRQVLDRINHALNGNLIVACVSSDSARALEIEQICKNSNIRYAYRNLMKPENLLKKDGHFNAKGNRELGQFLSKLDYFHKRDKAVVHGSK